MSLDLTNRTLIETGDGSHSLYVADLDEQYHSRHGAIQESVHVFIAMGMEARKEEHLRILEIGFGTGLNAWLTAEKTGGKRSGGNRSGQESHRKAIEYIGVEAYPLSVEEAASLNYPEQTGGDADLFNWLHHTPWGSPEQSPTHPHFQLLKLQSRIEEFDLGTPVNLIYFDAFAPEKQPELWTDAIFEKMYRLLTPGGTLATYSAKGEVRRTMIRAGFQIEKLPGPPGKREMLRAMKPFD